MSNRILLTISAGFMLVLGVIVTIIPFFSSLEPSAVAGSTLPHIDISKMENGTYVLVDDPVENYFRTKYMVIRDYDSKIYVHYLPQRDGRIVLPDISWRSWAGFCENFGPDMDGEKIKQNGVIRCHDFEIPELSENKEWMWTYSGKNLGKYTSDMEAPRYVIESGYIVIGKS